jgi:hypothetical protein
MKNQTHRLITLMKKKFVTPKVAMDELGIGRFSARWLEIKRSLGEEWGWKEKWIQTGPKTRVKAFKIVRVKK